MGEEKDKRKEERLDERKGRDETATEFQREGTELEEENFFGGTEVAEERVEEGRRIGEKEEGVKKKGRERGAQGLTDLEHVISQNGTHEMATSRTNRTSQSLTESPEPFVMADYCNSNESSFQAEKHDRISNRDLRERRLAISKAYFIQLLWALRSGP